MKRPRAPFAIVAALAVGAGAGAAGAALAGHGRPAERPRDDSARLARQIDPRKPRNVVLMLGDGMGDSEITLARYYAKGAGGRLNMDRLPFTGAMSTYSLKPATGTEHLPDYVPDSASTGTAWATGRRTIDGRISQGPNAGASTPGANAGYRTVLERAQRAGKRVGDVSTAELTDATPAVLAAHVSQRSCQGPSDTRAACPSEAKAAGGLGSIAEQEIDHHVDVLLGGGRQRFSQPLEPGGPETVTDRALDSGYRYVGDAAGLSGVRGLRRPLLGLFASGHMTQEYEPLLATEAGAGGVGTRCVEGNRPAAEPSLAAMTRKALRLLGDGASGRRPGRERGFFLQVEGASIDKRAHAADVCGEIGETVAFDRAVGVALRFQRRHRDTLVVVTADHAQAVQIVPEGSSPAGVSATLATADGAPIEVSYGTAAGGGSQQHTGSEVRIAAIGPRAANVLGVGDQTELFDTLLGRR
jgi:alkaline phosphatase